MFGSRHSRIFLWIFLLWTVATIHTVYSHEDPAMEVETIDHHHDDEMDGGEALKADERNTKEPLHHDDGKDHDEETEATAPVARPTTKTDPSQPPQESEPSVKEDTFIPSVPMAAHKEAPTLYSSTVTPTHSPTDGTVLVLTARNFQSLLRHNSSHTVWLIEFYASWCVHCGAFAPIYESLALELHTAAPHVRVAKINGAEERALTSRFGVTAFPSFYVVHGYHVYEFTQTRTQRNLMQFVQGGYLQQDPIPFYTSPMGPVGLVQGYCISSGLWAVDAFYGLQTSLGLSQLFAAMLVFGGLFVAIFVCIVIVAVSITSKSKLD
jgi:thiol-disulfide isomerase/thioredoxin